MDKNGFGTKEEIKNIAESIWNDMLGFGHYAFPRAHSTAYSLVSNATSYLKVHFPTEFFCAFLQQATDDEYLIIKEVSSTLYKVKFLLPNINDSKDRFRIKGDKIVWSLTSIKGVGPKAARVIVDEQPFGSFEDFFNRIDRRVINVRVVKKMITASLFKKFGNRNDIIKEYHKLRKDKEEFKSIKISEWNKAAKEIMPYLMKSIKNIYPDKLKGLFTIDMFYKAEVGDRVVVAGFIDKIRIINSKRGKMILMNIKNVNESFNIVCWNDMYKRLGPKVENMEKGTPIKISGFKNVSHIGEDQIALGGERECYIKIL